MTKRTLDIAARIALVLALLAFALQVTLAGANHPAWAAAGLIAWLVLLVISIGLFVWSSRLKS